MIWSWYFDDVPQRVTAKTYKGVALGKGSATRVPDKACTEVATLPITLPPKPRKTYELPYWRKKKMERKKK